MSTPSREKSLANLNQFIERQRAHLERTRQDLEKLDQLRDRVRADPEKFLEHIGDELNNPAFKRPPPDYLRLPAIDWSLLAGTDPSVFEDISKSLRGNLRERNPLRERLDALVRETGLPPMQRQVYHYVPPPIIATTDSANTSVELPEPLEAAERSFRERGGEGEEEDDLPESLFGSDRGDERTVHFALPPDVHRDGRAEDDELSENEEAPVAGRKHSSTFAQPWSNQEQRLLEKHLALIPPETKQRWAKISKEMKADGADRTARQVASRVQKMIAKMLKLGVTPDPAIWGEVGDTEKDNKGDDKKRKSEADEKGSKKVKPNPKPKVAPPKR